MQSQPYLLALLCLLSSNMLLDALEVSVVVVALPSIATDLTLPPASTQWLMSGFALGFGGLLLFANRLATVLGRRRVYLAALLAFAAASLVGGLLDDPVALFSSRFVKGFCAALTAPTGLAIIMTSFPEGVARQRALSVYTAFGAVGFSTGLLLSGLLTPLDWRWILLFPAPVALLLFVLGLVLLPRDDQPRDTSPRNLDLAGALTFPAAAVLAAYALVAGGERGWRDGRVLGAVGLAVLLVGAFVLVERAARWPLLPLRLLADPSLRRAVLVAAAMNGSFWGFLLIASFRWQQTLGWTPLESALAFLPASLLLAVAAPFSGRIVARFGTARLIPAGMCCATGGYAYQLVPRQSAHYLPDVLPTVVLVGIGFALAFAALHTSATQHAAPPDRAAAGAVYQTGVQIGGALTLAAVTAALTAGAATGSGAGQLGDRWAFAVISAICLAGLTVAATGGRDRAACAPDRGQSPTT
ncbi:MFS transporter [Salinispora fenicalii]|uniref:MFS transporter n=1 Tax=Salinispora fenicalii TaxID=1137263 RepID=UPI00067E76F4|nr:MFS transporter [Salinispora fenicalii]